jgi:hypothetical protein
MLHSFLPAIYQCKACISYFINLLTSYFAILHCCSILCRIVFIFELEIVLRSAMKILWMQIFIHSLRHGRL